MIHENSTEYGEKSIVALDFSLYNSRNKSTYQNHHYFGMLNTLDTGCAFFSETYTIACVDLKSKAVAISMIKFIYYITPVNIL